MQSSGNGCLMLGVAAVLLGAVLTGLGTRTMDLTGEAPDRVIVASGTGDAASDDPHNEQVQYGSAAVVLDREPKQGSRMTTIGFDCPLQPASYGVAAWMSPTVTLRGM